MMDTKRNARRDVLNFALIGTGAIANAHANAIKNIKDINLFAVEDISVDKAQAFACKYDTKAYADYDEILKDQNIDVVDITCPNHLHADFGIKAALRGKHVIVEKPIDTSVKRAEQLVDVCRSNNVKLAVISQHRYRPEIKKLKNDLDSGRFGKPIAINILVRRRREKGYYTRSDWKGKKDRSGGGALMLQAIHYIDIAQWLLGDIESVIAKTETFKHPIEVEDFGVAILKFKNGTIALIEGMTCCSKTLEDRIELSGENGTSVVTFSQERTFLNPNPKREESFIQDQLEDIVNSIINNKEIMIDGREGLKTLKIVDAIYKSAKLKKEVNVS